MLDLRFFKNPRFTAATTAITLVFFAMFGSYFSSPSNCSSCTARTRCRRARPAVDARLPGVGDAVGEAAFSWDFLPRFCGIPCEVVPRATGVALPLRVSGLDAASTDHDMVRQWVIEIGDVQTPDYATGVTAPA